MASARQPSAGSRQPGCQRTSRRPWPSAPATGASWATPCATAWSPPISSRPLLRLHPVGAPTAAHLRARPGTRSRPGAPSSSRGARHTLRVRAWRAASLPPATLGRRRASITTWALVDLSEEAGRPPQMPGPPSASCASRRPPPGPHLRPAAREPRRPPSASAGGGRRPSDCDLDSKAVGAPQALGAYAVNRDARCGVVVHKAAPGCRGWWRSGELPTGTSHTRREYA